MPNTDFYRAFEDKYRGSRELIKSRLQVYLPFVDTLKMLDPHPHTIDLGCGRGEWLELLTENGAHPRGVDIDEGMLKSCRTRGFDVFCKDALLTLKETEKESYWIVSGFHIAEHLPFEILQNMIQESLRVLKPGGLLILETPNPENIKVATANFYLDPTHIRPIPWQLLSFMTDFYGFARTKLFRLQEPTKEGDIQNITLSQLLNGVSPDYAVIAQKQAAKKTMSNFDELFAQEVGVSQEMLTEKFEQRLTNIETHAWKAQAQAQEATAQAQQAQAKAQEATAQAQEAWHHYAMVVNSSSWKMTAPLRHLVKGVRWFVKGSIAWLTFSPHSRPRRLLKKWISKAVRYLSQIVWLRRLALKVLNRMPRIKHKLQHVLARIPDGYQLKIDTNRTEEEFNNLLPPKIAVVRQKELDYSSEAVSLDKVQRDIQALRIEGHFIGSYSLASVNRNLLYRLQKDIPTLIFSLSPREGTRIDKIIEISGENDRTKSLNQLISNKQMTQIALQHRVALYHHYPIIEEIDRSAGLPVALFFWEESIVPESIIDTFNTMYAGIVVTSWFVKKALMDSGCMLPIQIVHLPMVPNPLVSPLQRDLLPLQQRPVNLLHISSAFPRKGVDVLLAAFDLLAENNPSVTLTIKTFHNPHNKVHEWIEQYVRIPYRERIVLIMEEYNDEKMAELYSQADIVVLPTRGEGLNMPAIEAGKFSRPLVVTGYGAHTDFASENNCWWIDYRFEPAQTHVSKDQSLWVNPSVNSLAQLLQTVIEKLEENNPEIHKKTEEFKRSIEERFFSPRASETFLRALWRIQNYHTRVLDSSHLSMTLISTWGEPCGIAEYSRYLVREWSKGDSEIHILAPHGRIADHDTLEGAIHLREGWTMGGVFNLSLENIETNIVWLQHHFAFFALEASLTTVVSRLRKEGKLLYITLHTTLPLLDFDRHSQEKSVQCLNGFDRIFVHTIKDVNNLKRLGITDNVALFPQGVEIVSAHKPIVKSESLKIGTFGFLLPHKGVDILIEAFAYALKHKYIPQNASLRLVTAVHSDSASSQERERCERLAKRLGILKHIEWYTDFLPEAQVHHYLGECDIIILPYQFTQESSSAAVRMAVSACSQVATTPAPIFDEVRHITYPVHGFDKSAVVDLLKKAASGFDEVTKQRIDHAREEWLSQRSWSVIAKRYEKLFHGALVNKKITAL